MLTSAAQTAHFDVDFEGPYLVRLTVDLALPGEDTQYVRMRSLTRFADVHLVAGGERRDIGGVIPVDVDPKGWSQEQNRNIQRLLAMVRRGATSGRSLFVDANRGRDIANAPNDFTLSTQFPGSDPADPTGSGVTLDNEGFGDFSAVQAAIDYAMDYAARGEVAPSSINPYYIFIQPGLYIEDLTLQPNVHLIGLGSDAYSDYVTYPPQVVLYRAGSVRIQTVGGVGSGHVYSPTTDTSSLFLKGVRFDNSDAVTTEPVLLQTRGFLVLQNCLLLQTNGAVTAGASFAIYSANATHHPVCHAYDTAFRSDATGGGARGAVSLDAPGGQMWLHDGTILGRTLGLELNKSLYSSLTQAYLLGTRIVSPTPGIFTAIQGYPDSLLCRGCNIQGDVRIDAFGAAPGSKVGAVSIDISHSYISGALTYDIDGATGATTLRLDSVNTPTAMDFPNGAPSNNTTSLIGTSLQYDPAYNSPVPPYGQVLWNYSELVSQNVQDALDEIVAKTNPFYFHGTVSFAMILPAVYLLDPTKSYVGLDTVAAGGPVHVRLPDTDLQGAKDGRIVYFKDEGGGAGVPGQDIRIYIDGPIGTIDGVIRNAGAPLVLNTNFASLTLMCRGESGGTSHWFVI